VIDVPGRAQDVVAIQGGGLRGWWRPGCHDQLIIGECGNQATRAAIPTGISTRTPAEQAAILGTGSIPRAKASG
jgi:hypothetical protein